MLRHLRLLTPFLLPLACGPVDRVRVPSDPCHEIGVLVDARRDGSDRHDEKNVCQGCPASGLTMPNYNRPVSGGETVIFGSNRRPVTLSPKYTATEDVVEVTAARAPAITLRFWVTFAYSDVFLNHESNTDLRALAEENACACAGPYDVLGPSLGARAVCGYLRRSVALVNQTWRDERAGLRIGNVQVHDVRADFPTEKHFTCGANPDAQADFTPYLAVLTSHASVAPEWSPPLVTDCDATSPVVDVFITDDAVGSNGGAEGMHCPGIVDVSSGPHKPLCPSRFPGTDWRYPRRVVGIEYSENRGILAHELGHVLGLMDHSTLAGRDPGNLLLDGSNLMHGSSGCSSASVCRNRSLTEGQIHRMHWRDLSGAARELGLRPIGDAVRDCPEGDSTNLPPHCPDVRTKIW
jgi:hypothetical protein